MASGGRGFRVDSLRNTITEKGDDDSEDFPFQFAFSFAFNLHWFAEVVAHPTPSATPVGPAVFLFLQVAERKKQQPLPSHSRSSPGKGDLIRCVPTPFTVPKGLLVEFHSQVPHTNAAVGS